MKYIVLVDIDGTIAEVHPDRLDMIKGENKDWDAFYKACHMDEPIKDVILSPHIDWYPTVEEGLVT